MLYIVSVCLYIVYFSNCMNYLCKVIFIVLPKFRSNLLKSQFPTAIIRM